MDIVELRPSKDRVQGLYCNNCHGWLDLGYTDFKDTVSGIKITITGLPVLHCPNCSHEYLPDRSRACIARIYDKAIDKDSPAIQVTRRKLEEQYNFTKVPFLYDADDYRYIPGLERPLDVGFLTPVFFKRAVLLKYDNAPGYRIRFASSTYGDIVADDGSMISFGLNRNGKVIMWLGDVASLPQDEQFYLRSENVDSDHSVGSQFYDGQIECIFTPPTDDRRLFKVRSDFIEAMYKRFSERIAHLDDETLALAATFNAPQVDTEKDRRHVADTLNKIYVESLDNAALGRIIKNAGGDAKSLGSLKRLQMALLPISDKVPNLLSPFFVLYDFRVAASHLVSADKAKEMMRAVTDRLGVGPDAGLLEIYSRLSESMAASYESLTKLVGI